MNILIQCKTCRVPAETVSQKCDLAELDGNCSECHAATRFVESQQAEREPKLSGAAHA